MPVFLLTLLARTGIPSRFQKAAAWGLIVLAAVALTFAVRAAVRGWVADQRQDAVTSYSKDLTIDAAARVTNAIEAADANAMIRDDRASDNGKELQREVDTKGSDAVAGPAVAGVLDRVREQQAAGRRGEGPAR